MQASSDQRVLGIEEDSIGTQGQHQTVALDEEENNYINNNNNSSSSLIMSHV
jgi:hypothetical protein